MNKDKYLSEVEKRLKRIFTSSKDGYKASPVERNRLEGFMNACVFMGFVTNEELSRLMDETHVGVFSETIEQRKAGLSTNWSKEVIDYSFYERPAFERK